MEARKAQVELLKAVVDNVDLLTCGFVPFQNFTMKHTGENWQIEMEAVQPE